MTRRELLKLTAAAGGAAALPAGIGRLLGQSASPATRAGSFPISMRKPVIDEGWGTGHDAAGVNTWDGVTLDSPPISGLAGEGPFGPTWDSLSSYVAPEWYRDAKFGIWAHWSPQCVPEDGDWYARNMYIEGFDQAEYHRRRYGHPSVFGYKDLCAQWTLLNWEPAALMERYERAGAKFFFALANHHDGFDTWDSKHQAWNASRLGPRRDVIGEWAKAARGRGLPFGVTVHAHRNWWWFQTSHICDGQGPQAGIPYDGQLQARDGRAQWWEGLDPQQLYGRLHGVREQPDEAYVLNFYNRVRDLIDQHDPDLLYFDNDGPPLGWAGMNVAAYFYNHNLRSRGQSFSAVLNIKHVTDDHAKSVVADIERGVTDRIMPHAWQSETCLGDWHYDRRRLLDHSYMKPVEVIHWLIDTVSKNGTFVLNVPGKPDGTIDADEQAILEAIGGWMRVNGEAIYATRPWRIADEGAHHASGGSFAGQSTGSLDSRDIRFTQSKHGDAIYALVLGWPESQTVDIRSFGFSSVVCPGRVATVELLGSDQKVGWKQSPDRLAVELPAVHPTDFAFALKVRCG